MRILLISVSLCAMAATAQAQSNDCKSIPQSTERLACYDRLSPPAKALDARPATGGGPTQYIDATANEDARMKKALRPICKNC